MHFELIACVFLILYIYLKIDKGKKQNIVLSFHLLYYDVIKIVVQRNLSLSSTSIQEGFKCLAQLYLHIDSLMYPSKPNIALSSRK